MHEKPWIGAQTPAHNIRKGLWVLCLISVADECAMIFICIFVIIITFWYKALIMTLNTWTMREVCVQKTMGFWLQTKGSCWHNLTGPRGEITVTYWHHIDRKQITDWTRFSSPGSSKAGSQTDKQEWPKAMNNCRIYQEKDKLKHSCMYTDSCTLHD